MLRAGAVMTGILFIVSYAVDVTLAALGVSPAATVLNDVAIALIAAAALIFYLFSSRSEQIFLRALERMTLTAELNHHLRRVLTEMRSVAEVADRLQMMDQAVEKADHVLEGRAVH
jgi:type IV secretory pathway VirB6-like protein